MIDIAVDLAKDKTVWVGGGGSLVTGVLAEMPSPSVQLPSTLEGWCAVTVSVVTIIYIVSKTVMLYRKGKVDPSQ